MIHARHPFKDQAILQKKLNQPAYNKSELTHKGFLLTLSLSNKLVKKLSGCQTAWIRMSRRVTRRLIWIQAVCIWHYSYA